MYKLEVKLKQHTPLIHFQWEQEGATLRASEVKPKLDRFVLEKLGKEAGGSKEDCYKRGLDIAKNKGWLIGESKALDYKMKIKLEKYPTVSFSNVESAKENLNDLKVEFASLNWYCDCLVKNVPENKRVLKEEGIPFKEDEIINYKKVGRKWPLSDILCKLGNKSLYSGKNQYIEIASHEKLIEKIIDEKHRKEFLVLPEECKSKLNDVDYFQDNEKKYCLIKSKDINKLNFSNEELEEIKKYILVKQEYGLDLSEKLKNSGIEYGYFSQEDALLVLTKDKDKESFQTLNKELEEEMGLMSIFEESDSNYLHISGLSREQRDILERKKIQYILLKNQCKYMVYNCHSEEIYEKLRKANIECEFENLSEEYLIGVNLNSVSQVLKANAISYLSSTPFFAQEDIIKGQREKIIADNGFCFHWDRWRKIDGKIIDKKGLLYPGNIIVGIECQNKDLSDRLGKQIEVFFLCHNFGTRQNKGFGGFEVMSKIIEEKFVKCEVDPVVALKENFDFVYKCESNFQNNFVQIFNKIRNDYQLIKSGINNPFNPNAYRKSKLFLFGVKNGGVRWEKRSLKKIINENDLFNKNGEKVKLYYKKDPITGEEDDKGRKVSEKTNNWGPDNYQYEFLRAALGLTEQYEFLLEKEGEEKPDYSDKIIVKVININEDKIERYKSPLFFKVIDKVIYLAGNDKSLQGNFQFEIFVKSNPNEKILHKPKQGIDLQLSVPKKFSLCDFMKFVMDEPEFEDYIDCKNNTKDAKIQLYHHRADH